MNISKLSDKELLFQCQKCGNNLRNFKKQFGVLLIEVNKRGLYKKKFTSIYHFAKVVGGLSESYVTEVLRISKKLENLPKLKENLKEIGISKARAVLPVINKDNEQEWIEKTKVLSRPALELCVKEEKEKILQIPHSVENYQTINFKVDKETELELRKFKQALEKQKGETLTLGQTLKELLKKSKEPTSQTRKITRKSTKVTRYIPAHIKRKAVNQTNGKCAHPKCNKPYNHLHHPHKFAQRPNHNNLTPLCKVHHELIHTGFLNKKWAINKKQTLDQYDQKYISKRSTANPP